MPRQIDEAPVRIETARLLLVRPDASDAASIFERTERSEVTRFLVGGASRSTTTKTFLRFSADEWERWPAGPR
jgi:RimJ/RimL family protein N-acetyltransferase